jgi:DNA polymerase-3 subunit gamma/tau
VFILATTEVHKFLPTILSRCQVFTFKKPAQEILKNLVLEVAKKEGRVLEPASAELVALLGDGSFRDTLVTLQKILSSSESKKISIEEVEAITGVPKNTIVNDFLIALNEEDPGKAVLILRQVAGENIDIPVFLKLAIVKLRAIMLVRLAPGMKPLLASDFTDEDFAFLTGFPVNKTLKLSAVLVALLEALSQKSFIPELPTELAIAKLFEKI